jgi:hypothetical protein
VSPFDKWAEEKKKKFKEKPFRNTFSMNEWAKIQMNVQIFKLSKF